jgi:hypothetical protein
MVQRFITLENLFLLFFITAIMYGIMNSVIDSKNDKNLRNEAVKNELQNMAKKKKKGTIEFQQVFVIPRVRFKWLMITSYSVYFITVVVLALLMEGN